MTAGGGVLVLVGTPLGNRDDLSPRARRAILEADLVLCEDTRSLSRLFGEGTELPPRQSCFAANEESRVDGLLERLAEGQTVAYVSEAGMPVWSDPGRLLIEATRKAGFTIDVVPGPTAAATALCHSGFPAAGAQFLGFLPRDGGARTKKLLSIVESASVSIVYESGRRVPALLRDLAEAAPDAEQRRVVIARELTKLHQEVLHGTLTELVASIDDALRGEVTVCIGGRDAHEIDSATQAVREAIAIMLESGTTRSKAKRLAKLSGFSSQDLYRRLSKKQDDT